MDYFGRNRSHLTNNNNILIKLQRDVNTLIKLIEISNNSMKTHYDNLEKKLITQSEILINVTKNVMEQSIQRYVNPLIGLIEISNNSIKTNYDNLENKLKTQNEILINVTKNVMEQAFNDLKTELNKLQKNEQCWIAK